MSNPNSTLDIHFSGITLKELEKLLDDMPHRYADITVSGSVTVTLPADADEAAARAENDRRVEEWRKSEAVKKAEQAATAQATEERKLLGEIPY